MSRRSFLSRGAATGGLVMLGAGGASVLAGCSSSATTSSTTAPASGSKPGINTGTPKKGGSATMATLAEIDGFFPPSNHWDTNGFLYANTVYDPLMWVGADGTVQPYLAKSLTSNADFTKWTLTLRSGVKFSDGSDLTSTVVKNNYTALAASALTGTALKGITSVDTPDPMTLVYNLAAPRPAFPAGLTTQVGYVVAQAMLDQTAAGKTPNPIGTGPFIWSSWVPNDHFTATRNPNYWRAGYPYLDQITFKPIPDDTQREATLKTGGVDLMLTSDPVAIKAFTGQSQYQLVDSLTGVLGEPSVAFIMLNTAVAPTNDLRIRQALAKGLDVTQILKIFGGGLSKPVNGLFQPGSPYYSSNTGYPTFDPAGAKALVDQYKAEHGTPSLTLTTVTDPRLESVVQIVQQMWNQVGFNTSVAAIQQATLITDFITGKFQAATSYQFGAVDPDLNYVWYSTTTVSPVGSIGLNFPRNSDPEIEFSLQSGRTSSVPATRQVAYKKLNQLLARDLPYLWLEQYPFAVIGDQRVQNFAGLTLPSGAPGYGFDEGIIFPTQIWLNG
ncbi:MAG TPA: ABC transporter substrate-binding protein [Acidimicrobiales bacterium]|nr:ABC transporter substrate-binding protein [Acidimicrobiales bacterium]